MFKKVCIHCGETKDVSEFVPDKRNKADGTYNVCKLCKKEQVRISNEKKDYKAKHRQLYAEDENYRNMMKQKSARFRAEHNEQVLLSQAKTRSIKINLDFDIELSDIVIPDICPLLGIPLERGVGNRSASSPSLDRIDNSRGYVKGNVKVISMLANTMKNNATKEQLLSFSKNIQSYLQTNDDIV